MMDFGDVVIHERVVGQVRSVRLVLDGDELALIANALNEVCNGLDIEDVEFFTRLGADRDEARGLLAELGLALDALPPKT